MKSIIFWGCFFLLSGPLHATNSDSLWTVWGDTTQTVEDRCGALNKITWSIIRSDQDSAVVLARMGAALAKEGGAYYLEGQAINSVGAAFYMKGDHNNAEEAYRDCLALGLENDDAELKLGALSNLSLVANIKGDNEVALEYLFEALDAAGGGEFPKAKGKLFNNIALQYMTMEDYENGLKYAEKGLEYRREIEDDQEAIESSLDIVSTLYGFNGEHAKALKIKAKLLQSSRETGDTWREMQYLLSIAEALKDSGAVEEAREHLQEALRISAEEENTRAEVSALEILAQIDLEAGHYQSVDRLTKRGLGITVAAGMDRNTKLLALRSYEANKKLGRSEKALAMYELYIEKRDSLNSTEVIRAGVQKDLAYEYGQKAFADSLQQEQELREKELLYEQEVFKEQFRTQIAIGISVLLLILALVILRALQLNRRSKNLISAEKKRSDELLLNILPSVVANELKAEGKSHPRRFNDVTVLFTDFKGFTAVAASLRPEELVALLDESFAAFDEIAGRFGIEKIKTIGDAYMCASGLPLPCPTHAIDVVAAALEIRKFVEAFNAKKKATGKPYFEIRIGIHTGPIVAGIVGSKKFQYDIWGDTVNTASRMESASDPGKINISQATYELIKEEYHCVSRGKVAAKGKGEIDMYFVESKITLSE